jgi:hypothetical protein
MHSTWKNRLLVQDIFDRRIAENKYEATDLKRF